MKKIGEDRMKKNAKANLIAVLVFGSLIFAVQVPLATAGCGCEKPAPLEASVRPAFASPGDEVTLFDPKLENGKLYVVSFWSKTSGDYRIALARADVRRDFADEEYKPQLVVSAPDVSAGPTVISVFDLFFRPVFDVGGEDFTMLQRPVALAEVDGVTEVTCYRAAVGADGTVYIPVDITDISERMRFSGIGMDYPLLFGAADVAIYNNQGFLMQLLGPEEAEIFAISDSLGHPHSFELEYDRHEFVTYKQKHAEDEAYFLDPDDERWHMNGTPHIDHDHLVVTIRGIVEDEGSPQPGLTPPFTLDLAMVRPDAASGSVTDTTIEWSNECKK